MAVQRAGYAQGYTRDMLDAAFAQQSANSHLHKHVFTAQNSCIDHYTCQSKHQSRTRMFSSSHSWHGSKPCHWFQQSPIAPHDNFMVYLGSNISISTTDKPICSQITPRDAQCVPWGFPGQGSSKLFTALFTSRDPGLPVSSSAGYGPF